MTREEAIETLKANYPDACYEQLREAVDAAIEALKAQDGPDTNVGSNDLISRRAAIDVVKRNTFRLTFAEEQNCEGHVAWSAEAVYSEVMEGALLELPSVQPEPISEEYAKAVRNWLVNYQVKCAELQGRYTPYEVLGWIVSDWRKDNGTW